MRKGLLLVTAVFLLTGVLFFPVQAAQRERTLVKMETGMGDIVIELYPDKAPKSVANFLRYVDDGAYNGTIFHRVIRGFMIQGGGLNQNMTPSAKTYASIENEAKNGLKNERYTVAMARTGQPHSATNQFFINVENNKFLDYPGQDGWGYAVFGKVVDGTGVVDKIKAVPTGNRAGHQDVPVTPVLIKKMYRLTLR
jgi:peptidyl-prolyl cis-trans isomerase A (cyclophilin A)/peptidyl-prolyl cis-trans isomerase B (cyclophilin B)